MKQPVEFQNKVISLREASLSWDWEGKEMEENKGKWKPRTRAGTAAWEWQFGSQTWPVPKKHAWQRQWNQSFSSCIHSIALVPSQQQTLEGREASSRLWPGLPHPPFPRRLDSQELRMGRRQKIPNCPWNLVPTNANSSTQENVKILALY